jgi:hypothetical protein
MRSIRSVIGVLRKIKKCESVLVVVGRGLVGDTSVGGVSNGICTIEVVLAFGLVDRTKERNVFSRSVKIVQSSTVNWREHLAFLPAQAEHKE